MYERHVYSSISRSLKLEPNEWGTMVQDVVTVTQLPKNLFLLGNEWATKKVNVSHNKCFKCYGAMPG